MGVSAEFLTRTNILRTSCAGKKTSATAKWGVKQRWDRVGSETSEERGGYTQATLQWHFPPSTCTEMTSPLISTTPILTSIKPIALLSIFDKLQLLFAISEARRTLKVEHGSYFTCHYLTNDKCQACRTWSCVVFLHNRAERITSTPVSNLQWPIAQHDLSHGHTTVKMEMTLLSLAARI